jgi:hypothetical protein
MLYPTLAEVKLAGNRKRCANMQIQELKGAVNSKDVQITQQAGEIERLKADVDFQDGELSSLKDAVAAQVDEVVCHVLSLVWLCLRGLHTAKEKGCAFNHGVYCPTHYKSRELACTVSGNGCQSGSEVVGNFL